VRITHKVDYAVRAMTALARAAVDDPGRPIKRVRLSETESIPPAFLDDILRDLRNGGLAASQRGADGGWRLARAPETITVADVIRAVEGPLADVRGIRPHELRDDGVAQEYVELWVATRAALRSVLDEVTIAHLAAKDLPATVKEWLDDPAAWTVRSPTSS
jgi:Rrf2 family protein